MANFNPCEFSFKQEASKKLCFPAQLTALIICTAGHRAKSTSKYRESHDDLRYVYTTIKNQQLTHAS